MHAFEVSALGLVARLHERPEAGLHERRHAAAEDALLAEEVRLRLFAEGRLKNASPGSADAVGVGKRDIACVPARVLVYGEEAGYSLAFLILASHRVAGAFRGDHDDIGAGGRLDLAIMDVEAVREGERAARPEVGRDAFPVEARLFLVVDEDHRGVRLGDRVRRGGDLQPRRLGPGPGLAALVQADHDVYAAVFEVERVGVTLAAVADHGHGFIPEIIEGAVFFVVHLCHFNHSSRNVW